jgi:hypothetical protein
MAKIITIISEDALQRGYEYELSEPEGENFDAEFKPQLTPKELMELGVFGGAYFEGHIHEYPKTWFTKATLSKIADKDKNFFHVHASQSREEWIRKGWINANDPRGWLQWYFRYYLGRRIPTEDARQIRRWKLIRRHAAQVQKYCTKGNLSCRPGQRQALLHWAYDSRVL